MEKHVVLAKFFETKEKLKKDKHADHDENGSKKLRRQYNLSPSACTLLCTLLENGSLNQRTIAKLMNISSQAVSESIKKLELNQLIIKENGTHNNEKIISLTDKGSELAKNLDKGIKIHASEVFKNFTQEELVTLYSLLEKFGE